ncbi:major facilitator superfamily domain-containing protein [Dendryphion nanum]|uniref:Major facilitator superfamily domain-containing protein n=1 Tax=Dendryphion nanum TaxID=256645 RepID=A0A9P9D3T8_9PLEO|nr:major facilitator superfamily domain-containing protein [Dendryphion nanum]
MSANSLQDPYPEVELAPPPRAHPLAEPRLISPLSHIANEEEEYERPPSFLPDPGARPKAKSLAGSVRAKKHESYNLASSNFLITSTGKRLNLPVPSNSKFDPLNWSAWKTAGAWVSVSFYSVVALTAAQAASVVLDGIQASFQSENVEPWLLKWLVTAPTLLMGLGCFLWIPLSIGLGRRPVLLVATITLLLALLGAGRAQTFSQLLVAVCFLGLCEGLALSLAFLMVIDMTYISQRPRGVALMWSISGCIGTSGVALVPVMSRHARNWRQFYYYWMIPALASLLFSFLLYPETYFKRPTVAFDGLIVLQSATEKLTVYQDVEQDSEIYRDLPEHPTRAGFAGFRDRLGLARSPFASWTSTFYCYIQICYCAANPLIFWVFITSSFNFASMMFIGATYARVLLKAPYNLPRDVVGTVNCASGTGSVFAFIVWCLIITRLMRRHRGAPEAEHYLVGYLHPVIFGALSSVLYGFAVENEWHWGFFYLAYGLNGFSFVSLMIANTLWVTEAFPRWAAPALAAVSGGCYLISFTMSFALVPWINAHGYKWVGIELMIFQIVGGSVALPVAFWGKNARQAIQGRWSDDRSGALRPL